MILFDRTLRLVVYALKPDDFFATAGEAVVISDLRCRFEIKLDLSSKPNKATIITSNLGARLRHELETGRLKAQLYAGYGEDRRLLAVGDVVRATTKREVTDLETTIELGDGQRAHQFARMDKTYRGSTPLSAILNDACRSLGLDPPRTILESPELKTATVSGLSADGPTRLVLTKLLARFGYGWSIQRGRMQIMRPDDLRAGEAWRVAADTGMVGNPERKLPESPDQKAEVNAVTLIQPEIVPGSLAEVTGELWTANAKITDVTHSGDTRGPEWYTKLVARPHHFKVAKRVAPVRVAMGHR